MFIASFSKRHSTSVLSASEQSPSKTNKLHSQEAASNAQPPMANTSELLEGEVYSPKQEHDGLLVETNVCDVRKETHKIVP